MTTLDIGTIHVNNTQISNIAMTDIKASIIQFLENDFISTKRKKSSFSKLDEQLRNLKTVDNRESEDLKKAFDSLNEKLADYKHININETKREYFDKKYNL